MTDAAETRPVLSDHTGMLHVWRTAWLLTGAPQAIALPSPPTLLPRETHRAAPGPSFQLPQAQKGEGLLRAHQCRCLTLRGVSRLQIFLQETRPAPSLLHGAGSPWSGDSADARLAWPALKAPFCHGVYLLLLLLCEHPNIQQGELCALRFSVLPGEDFSRTQEPGCSPGLLVGDSKEQVTPRMGW